MYDHPTQCQISGEVFEGLYGSKGKLGEEYGKQIKKAINFMEGL
jgi:hypothetical protein